MAAAMKPLQITRRVVLGVILLGLTVLTFLHQRIQGVPTIDALCPFGGFESLLKFVASGVVIKKLEAGTMVLSVGIVALGIVLSRFFCGWFCAFGALQGIFGWIGKKLFGKKKRPLVPAKLDKYLRWIKYPVLVVIIYLSWKTGELVIRPYDPWAAYGHLSAGLAAVWGEFAIGLILLVVSLLLSVVYDRAFCKYVCPLGAVNAILGRIPLFRIKRVASTCISCHKCDKVCPMNVDVSKPDAVNDPECIGCMECVTSCPTKTNSLQTTLGGRALKLGAIVGIGFAIYFATVVIGQAVGYSAKPLSALAAAGKLNVADIKGSSTWDMVAESFGVELEKLYREAGVDMKKVPRMTMLKDTGKVGGYKDFEADAVRVAVAKILGVPYVSEKDKAAAKPAESAAAQAAASPEASAAPAAAPAAAAPAAVAPAASAAPVAPKTAAPAAPASGKTLVVPADFALEGTMSIDQVAAALNASPEAVVAKLGLPADIARDKPLRDMKDQYGYSMPDLKERIKK
jgi:polyferredoxin